MRKYLVGLIAAALLVASPIGASAAATPPRPSEAKAASLAGTWHIKTSLASVGRRLTVTLEYVKKSKGHALKGSGGYVAAVNGKSFDITRKLSPKSHSWACAGLLNKKRTKLIHGELAVGTGQFGTCSAKRG